MVENASEYLLQGMVSGASPWERAGAAIAKMAEAMGEFVAAVADACSDVFPALSEVLHCQKAYACAEKANPQWVRFAKYHKKKRIRKKYHNRIMREYGGSM